ncbi:MAG: glycosyltransferase family 39 protein [Deltaproteobacteria bacterium]|nr:glycosyltransferase family 39 protein [Deltaproteobacteria bacterium]
MNKNKIIPYSLFAVLIILFIIRLVLITKIDLIPEETYYWQWSRHLSLSYYDMSPMVAYAIALTTLFGKLDSQFFVRLAAPVISLILSIYVYAALKKITNDNLFSLLWAVMLNAIPIFNVGSILIVYGNLQMLFFSLTILLLIYLILTKKDFYWYLIGISTGLALLSKYTAVFIYPIVFLFLASSKNYRKYFLKKEPYLALLISLALFSPVIIWNYLNNFVSLRHLMTLSGHFAGFSVFLSNLFLFLISQMGIVSPFIFIIMITSIFIGFYLGLKENNDIYLVLSISSLAPFLYFIYQCAKTTVQPNWPVFLYFSAFLLSFILILRLNLNLKSQKLKKIATYFYALSFITGLIFSLIIFLEPYYPLISIKISKNPMRDVLGWKKLGYYVDKELAAHKKDNLLIAARRFQVASELAYYVKGKPQTYSFNYFIRDNQYAFWNNFNDKKGRNFLYIIDTKYGKNIENKLCQNFKSCTLLKEAAITDNHETIRTVKIYLLKDFLYKDKYLFEKFSSKEF